MEKENVSFRDWSLGDMLVRLVPKPRLREIAAAYLKGMPREEKEFFAEFISRLHVSRPRAKNLIGMPTARLATMLADVIKTFPEEMTEEMLLHFFSFRRTPLAYDFGKLLGLDITKVPRFSEEYVDFDQEVSRIKDNAFTMPDNSVDEIWRALSDKYPVEDVALFMAYRTSGIPAAADDIAHLIQQYLDTHPLPAESGDDPVSLVKSRLLNLKHQILWLSLHMQLDITRMKEHGTLPSLGLNTEIEAIHAEFKEIIEDLIVADVVPEEFVPQLSSIHNVERLDSFLNLIETYTPNIKQLKDQISTAIAVLQRLSRLSSRTNDKSIPILRFRKDVQKLLSKLTQGGLTTEQMDIAEAIVKKDHPFALILELIENENLSLDEYEKMKSIVLQEMNQDLAMAALRGKLYIEDEGTVKKPQVKEPPATPAAVFPKGPIKVEAPIIETKAASEPVAEVKRLDKQFYSLCAKGDPAVLALEILANKAEDPLMSLKCLTLRMIAQRQYLPAITIAERVETLQGDDRSFSIPSSLIRALAISPYVSQDDNPVSQAFVDSITVLSIEDYFVERQFAWNQTLSILTASAVLAPALSAPALAVMDHLADLKIKGCPGLAELFSVIRQAAAHFVAFTPDTVAAIARWEDAKKSHQAIVNEAGEWISKAKVANVKYAPARAVWTNWMGHKGFVGSVIYPASEDQRAKRTDVHSLAELLADDHIVTQEIGYTDKKVFPNRVGDDIAGAAKQVLLAMAQEAAAIALRWADSVKKLEEVRPPAYIEQASKDLEAIVSRIEEARKDVGAIERESSLLAGSVAAGICLESIKCVEKILDWNTTDLFVADGTPEQYLLINKGIGYEQTLENIAGAVSDADTTI